MNVQVKIDIRQNNQFPQKVKIFWRLCIKFVLQYIQFILSVISSVYNDQTL